MVCGNVIEIYNNWFKEQKAKGNFSDAEINEVWVKRLKEKRTGERLALISDILKFNPSGDNEISIMYNGKKSVPTRMIDAMIVDGEYVIFTPESNYTFEQDSFRSKLTDNGKFVVMPIVEAAWQSADARARVTEFDNERKASIDARSPTYSKMVKDYYNGERIKQYDGSFVQYREQMINMIKDIVGTKVIVDDNFVIDQIEVAMNSLITGLHSEKDNTVVIANAEKLLKDPESRAKISEKIHQSVGKYIADNVAKKKLSESDAEIELEKENTDSQKKIDELLKRFDAIIDHDNVPVLLHELVHAGSRKFMEQNPNHPAVQRIDELFELAKEKYDGENMWLGSVESNYWMTNKYEFIAEALSKPDLMEKLMSIEVEEQNGLTNLFQVMLDSLLRMVGLKGTKLNNAYAVLLDSFVAIVEENRGVKSPLDPGIDNKIRFDLAARLEEFETDTRFGTSKLDHDDVEGRHAEFEQQNLDLVNNPENAIELLDGLIDDSNVEMSAEEKKLLKGTLKMFVRKNKKFIPKMAVYIRDMAEANGGAIELKGKRKGIYLSTSRKRQVAANQMSAAEAYVHEIIHAATEYAKRDNSPEARAIMHKINNIYVQAMTKIKVEHLMPNEADSIDYDAELEIAEDMLLYMRGGVDRNGKTVEGSISEFMALAASNEKVNAVVRSIKVNKPKINKSESLWDAFLTQIENLFDLVMGKFTKEKIGMRGDQALMKYMEQLASINNLALHEKRAKEDAVSIPIKVFRKANKALSKKIIRYQEKLQKSKLPSKKEDGMFYIPKVMWRYVNDPEVQTSLEMALSESGFKPEGTVQTILRRLRNTDPYARLIELLELQSAKIDGVREEIYHSHGSLIVKGFKGRLSKAEQESLSVAGLNIDLGSIYDKYNPDEIVGFYSEPEKLTSEITKIQSEVEGLADGMDKSNFYNSQAKGLGRYMATGVTGSSQRMNKYMIARSMYDTRDGGNSYETNAELEAAIDKLATLEAISYVPKKAKEKMVKVMKRDEKGISNMAAYSRSYNEQALAGVYSGKNITAFIKGEMKDISEDGRSIKFAPTRDKAKMEAMGYKFERVFETGKNDPNRGKVALYVNDNMVRQKHDRASIRMTTNLHGSSMMKSVLNNGINADWADSAREVSEINTAGFIEMKRQKRGIVEPVVDNLIPVYNDEKTSRFSSIGSPVNYKYAIPKAEKTKLLALDRRGSHVLGRMFASLYDNAVSANFNKIIVKELFKDQRKNYVRGEKYGNNRKEYIVIGDKSKNKEAMQLWAAMPQEIKDEIRSSSRTRNVAIRRDQMYEIFGLRSPSILDFKMMKLVPKGARHMVGLIEMFWTEIVKIFTIDVVVRTPAVILGNIASNYTTSVELGDSMVNVLKNQLQAVKSLRQYLADNKTVIATNAKIAAKLATDKEIRMLKGIKVRMEANPVKPMVDFGLYQPISEEITRDDLQSKNRATKAVDDVLDKMPTMVKDGLNTLFMTEKTGIYQSLLHLVQYSDFVARYARVQYLMKQGMSQKEAMIRSLDDFINYAKKDSKLMTLFSKLGLVKFAKFFLGTQNPLRKGLTEQPLRFAMSAGGQMMFGDLEDTMDHSLFTKDLGTLGYFGDDIVKKVIDIEMIDAVKRVL